MKGLRLFQKTSGRRMWNVASFHSPHSLTWSWVLSVDFARHEGTRRLWPLFSAFRSNNGLQWWARIPGVCVFTWQRQRPMWYRDLYARDRYRLDQIEGGAWLSDQHPQKMRDAELEAIAAGINRRLRHEREEQSSLTGMEPRGNA